MKTVIRAVCGADCGTLMLGSAAPEIAMARPRVRLRSELDFKSRYPVLRLLQ
ncbi:MAG: hypothetical protein WKF75_08865 [Singulisphaera sp.]